MGRWKIEQKQKYRKLGGSSPYPVDTEIIGRNRAKSPGSPLGYMGFVELRTSHMQGKYSATELHTLTTPKVLYTLAAIWEHGETSG